MTALAGALAMMGCASVAPERPAWPFVVPSQTVRHGMDADAYYRTGRYFQGQMRYGQAVEAYRSVLTAQPGHVDALNALGVIHSLQGQPDIAEQYFRRALQADPRAARVHNNLGYHLLQSGRGGEAIVAFERASELEPGNAGTQANLLAARAAAGLATGAVATAAAAAAAPVAAPVTSSAAVMGAAPIAAIAARVEVSNGNGASGLARRIAGILVPASMPRPRLTNDKPYGVQASRIQYAAGFEQLARDINARLPAPLPMARIESLERDVRVRVLLGKDFPPQPLAAEISTRRNS